MSYFKMFLFVHALIFCVLSATTNAELSSTNYQITSSVISGGGGVMSSTNYKLIATFGQPTPIGNSDSTSYVIDAGFLYTMLTGAVGDVNGDGAVNLKDVIAALQVVTGQSPATIIKEADTDGDGKIGMGEVLHLIRMLRE